MIDQIFKWCAENAIICTGIGVVLAFVLGASKDKLKFFGFTVSQWIRRMFGAKLEKAIEDSVDAISDGLKSDNK